MLIERCITTQTISIMDPEMDPKLTQNGPEMDPKWTQNGPKMDPKWTRSLLTDSSLLRESNFGLAVLNFFQYKIPVHHILWCGLAADFFSRISPHTRNNVVPNIALQRQNHKTNVLGERPREQGGDTLGAESWISPSEIMIVSLVSNQRSAQISVAKSRWVSKKGVPNTVLRSQISGRKTDLWRLFIFSSLWMQMLCASPDRNVREWKLKEGTTSGARRVRPRRVGARWGGGTQRVGTRRVVARRVEPSSWFPPKFPSGQLELNSFIR